MAVRRGLPRAQGRLRRARHPGHRRQRQPLQPDRRDRDPADPGRGRARRHRGRHPPHAHRLPGRRAPGAPARRDPRGAVRLRVGARRPRPPRRYAAAGRPRRRAGAQRAARRRRPGCSPRPTTSPTAASPRRWPSRACATAIGARVELAEVADGDPFVALFSESAARVLVTVAPEDEERLFELAAEHGVPVTSLGQTRGDVARRCRACSTYPSTSCAPPGPRPSPPRWPEPGTARCAASTSARSPGVRFFAALWVVVYHSHAAQLRRSSRAPPRRPRSRSRRSRRRHPGRRPVLHPVRVRAGAELHGPARATASSCVPRCASCGCGWPGSGRCTCWSSSAPARCGSSATSCGTRRRWTNLTWSMLGKQALMVQQWFPPEHGQTSWVGPAWSLSAEWLAYLVFPIVVLAVARLHRGLRARTLFVLAGCRDAAAGRGDHRARRTWAVSVWIAADPVRVHRPGCCCARPRRGCDLNAGRVALAGYGALATSSPIVAWLYAVRELSLPLVVVPSRRGPVRAADLFLAIGTGPLHDLLPDAGTRPRRRALLRPLPGAQPACSTCSATSPSTPGPSTSSRRAALPTPS